MGLSNHIVHNVLRLTAYTKKIDFKVIFMTGLF
jgi:hypothetical protein